MKNKIITIILAVISFSVLNAQEFTGDWKGELDVQGTSLEVIFHISEKDGTYSSTMDSPNQGAFGIAMDETIIEGKTLKISAKQMKMNLSGTIDGSGKSIDATFNQGPMSMPLALQKIDSSAKKEVSEPTNNHPITGDWNGALDIMGQTLRLTFHITENNGEFSSTMDSPDQNAFGMSVDETIVEGNEISIKMKNARITMNGSFDEKMNTIDGNFNQAGRDMPLKLSRESIEKKEAIRPQEPKTFDYKQEEVKFINPKGGHKLAGTLTIPKSGSFAKVAILVSGSGPQNRNEELIGHKPFLVISDYLTRNGIAVLRYDDRGIAESEGDFKSATSDDFATDTEAAAAYLRSRTDMAGKSIGVIGHSEGGMIAPIVASRTPIDFIVLLAGPGREIDFLLEEQSTAISKVMGVEERKIQFNKRASKVMFDYMKKNTAADTETLEKELKAILEKEINTLTEKDKEEMGDIVKEIESQVEMLTSPWFRYFITFSPNEYLEKVTCPVLAINGEKDLQVLPKSNLKAIGEALAKGGNLNYTIRELPKLNHLFQVSEDGDPNKYGEIEETFNEAALELIVNWVNNYDL